MAHAFVTVALPFDGTRMTELGGSLDRLGNPASAQVRAALDRVACIHFMSIDLVPPAGEGDGHLLMEISGDGDARSVLAALESAIGGDLHELLGVAGISLGGQRLVDFLLRHRLDLGQGWFSTIGLAFTGTPGMSVARIRREAELASRVRDMMGDFAGTGSALATLEGIRDRLWADEAMKWVFIPEPTPCLLGPPPSPWRAAGISALLSALANFLWPAVLLAILLSAIAWPIFGVDAVGHVFGLALGLETLLGLYLFTRFRREELREKPDDLSPASAAIEAIMKHENFGAQNHLFAVSRMKPGMLRLVALRLAFWIVRQAVTYFFRPGFLATIGTIHFARWVRIPGTGKLVFLSNFGGTWESYLEDFIEKAHAGLTGVWSNTIGFPRTNFLFFDGATDGDRFKRWARRQQLPTLFWYSAYPELTTAQIRTHAAIRQGIALADTESAAAAWLSCFGSAPRADATIETAEVPTLVLGGLSRLRYARTVFFALPDEPSRARAWLAEIEPSISYGDCLSADSALVLGLSARGLEKLGLQPAAIAEFPIAFQQGSAAPWRARAIGDVGPDAPEHWEWGAADREVDAVVVLYDSRRDALERQLSEHLERGGRFGLRLIHTIQLADLPAKGERLHEPFGFADGISQPIIRGTGRWADEKGSHQLVEPGEFILGYPDNNHFIPPSPTVAASDDPAAILPALCGRDAAQPPDFSAPQSTGRHDFGRNGTFLVIRQLEQHVAEFEAFLSRAAATLRALPRDAIASHAPLEEWVAAKMVGRWRDGTSLLRHPQAPGGQRYDELGRLHPKKPDNDFLFGVEDPAGLRCPFGAHIRRANPRDSFDPGSAQQLAIVNRHRILRVGRPYAPPEGKGDPGLVFMCLNGDIERQFEFIQQSWLLSPGFPGLEDEIDPIFGHRCRDEIFTVPTARGPLRIAGLKDFVTTRGAGYFFLPSRSAVRYLRG